MRGGGGYGFWHFLSGLMGLMFFLALLTALAFLAYKLATRKGWLAKGGGHRGGHGGHRHEPGAPQQHGPFDALRILDERLARGEIEIDDYRARRDALTGNSFPPFTQPPQSPASSQPPQPPVGPGVPGAPWPTPHPGHVPPSGDPLADEFRQSEPPTQPEHPERRDEHPPQ